MFLETLMNIYTQKTKQTLKKDGKSWLAATVLDRSYGPGSPPKRLLEMK